MIDDYDRQLEEAEWSALCRELGARSFPKGLWERRKAVMLRRWAAEKAELDALIANAIADPTQPDPRNWRF